MKKQWKKLMLSVLLIVCVSILNCSSVFAANGITRGEWIHNLVKTFDMKIEDGLLPDDYYGDISDSKYYDDILIATNFGVIDLEAGEDFNPDKMVTREFAAHTLNYCLGYELEDATYTMKDKDDLTYADDAQVAVNFGWLSLDNDKFMPNDTITSNESTKMLEYATTVLKDSQIDTAHKNTYTFADNVKEIPESTSFEWTDDDHVVIYDTGLSINKGDYFAVYEYGIAYTYKALDVTTDDSSTVIEVEDVDYEESVDDVDAQGTVDVELGDFIPASDDITVENEYETNATSDENGAPTSKGTKKVKEITLTRNVGPGTVTCNITDISINYKINKGKYLFCVDGKATASYTISGKASKSILLGSIPVDGLGKITVTLNLSANGSATVSFSSNFQCGVEYSKRDGVRKIMNFTTPTWHFSAKAELKAGYNVAYEISVPSIANGRIFADLGIKSTPDAEVFGDGKKPTCCIDLPAWFYTTVGYSVKICGTDIINESIPIYSQNNSPLYVCYHLEDGMRVSACTRGADATRVGRRGYYTLTDADGSYSGNAFVAPWANASKPIFEYRLNDDEQATITKYTGSVAYLTIPDELDGYPVIGIGNEVFKGNTSLRGVVIPDSITTIGDWAFSGCKNLSDITLSKGLVTLGKDAFAYTAVKSIEIPKSLETAYTGNQDDRAIYDGPFYNCEQLKTVSFEIGSTEVAQDLFAGCTGLESIVIPDTLTTIERGAFSNCTSLNSVTISNSCTTIGNWAFKNCTSLPEINIPNSVTAIGNYVFSGCSNLKKVHLPNIRVNVTEGMFENCSSLSEINLPDTLTAIQNKAFINCTSLAELVLPKNVTTIENDAFSGCTGLTKITIPESMRTIGKRAFSHCEALTDLEIAEGTTSIGEKAFEYCVLLEKVKLPDTLNTLGASAFTNSEKISDLNLGAGLTVIPKYCFYQIPALKKVILPQQVTTINDYAFANCTALKDITINQKVTSIKTSAFSYSDMVIHGVSGSYAETFAKENDYMFVPLDNPATAIQLNATKYSIARGKTKQLSATITPLDSSDQLTWTSSDEDIVTVTDTGLIKGIKVGNATIIAMAGDVVETCDITVYEGVTGVDLNKTSNEMTVGDTFQLTATVYPEDAANQKISWSSSDEKVATVDKDGLVTAKAYGKATITVTTEDGGYTRSCDITVSPIAVTGITLNKKTVTVGVAESFTLVPTITPENATDKSVTWTSSKPAVATVKDGVITGVSEGTTIVIAKTVDGAKTASCTITVKGGAATIAVTGVTLDQTEATVETDSTVTLAAQILPENATNKKISWSSDNEEVATAENGVVTSHKAGTATITVTTADGGYTAACIITVKDLTVEGITLDKQEADVEAGNCIALRTSFIPDKILTANVTWSSDNETIATVNSYGIVNAISEGTANITATTDNGLTAVCTVTVTPSTRGEDFVSVEGLEITGASSTEIQLDGALTLSVIVLPENATNPNVIWTSTNPSVASIDDTGKVTLNHAGQVTFIATSESTGISTEFTMTVLPIPSKTYTITYHLDGGVNSANNPDSYLDGDAFSFENPTKEGYIFDGWFTDAQYTNPISGITKDTTGDITLYAKWTEEIIDTTWKYSVTFSGNGATSGTMSDLTECESSVSYKLPTCGYSRTGFLFNGWNTAKDGSGDSLTDGADILNLTEEDNGTVTLYAQWKPISYTIHFDKNTAKTGSMKRVYPKYGRNYRLPACGFKKPGYTFTGWNTRKDGKGTTYKNQSNVKNLTTTNGKVVFLYAQWKKVSLATAGKPTLGNYAAGRLTVTCKAVKGADGYLIQYSTNKNMKNAKTVSSKTLKKNIYKLKKGTTYYVRVRAYKVDSAGKKICGKYSGVQAKKLTK